MCKRGYGCAAVQRHRRLAFPRNSESSSRCAACAVTTTECYLPSFCRFAVLAVHTSTLLSSLFSLFYLFFLLLFRLPSSPLSLRRSSLRRDSAFVTLPEQNRRRGKDERSGDGENGLRFPRRRCGQGLALSALCLNFSSRHTTLRPISKDFKSLKASNLARPNEILNVLNENEALIARRRPHSLLTTTFAGSSNACSGQQRRRQPSCFLFLHSFLLFAARCDARHLRHIFLPGISLRVLGLEIRCLCSALAFQILVLPRLRERNKTPRRKVRQSLLILITNLGRK